MNEVYLVEEIHEQLEQPLVIGVCSSRELAEELKQRNENLWDLEDCEITQSRYIEMQEAVFSNYDSNKTYQEQLIETFPEYSVTDIDRAIGEYDSISYCGTVIKEINLFSNETDVAAYGIDYRRTIKG